MFDSQYFSWYPAAVSDSLLTFTIPALAPKIRVIKAADGEPWFVAKDVCDALGISDVSTACKRLPTEDVRTNQIGTNGGDREALIVSEPGLYWLVIRSDKPAARPFIMWVTHEVLPSIRKTGQYVNQRGQRRNVTKWGYQPIREVIMRRGFTMRDFVDSANGMDIPGVGTFTYANAIGWTTGACLPAESLIKRAEVLLGVPRFELFTSEVISALPNRGAGKRQSGPRKLISAV